MSEHQIVTLASLHFKTFLSLVSVLSNGKTWNRSITLVMDVCAQFEELVHEDKVAELLSDNRRTLLVNIRTDSKNLEH